MHAGPTSRRTAEPPWISFADGLSAMLFVFMLTTVWAMGKMKAKTEEVLQTVPTSANLEKTLQGELSYLQECIARSGPGQVYPNAENHSLAVQVEPLWFEACSTGISDAGIAAVQAMRSCVLDTVQDRKLADGSRIVEHYDVELVFEGHTDSNGVSHGCPFPSNWELSGARAASVLRRFRCDAGVSCAESEAGVAATLAEEVRSIGEERLRFSAVGMADTQPTWASICERLGDPLCPATGGRFSLRGPALVTWANQGSDRVARQRLLRRVDLRLDLHPHLESVALADVGSKP